jgi:hypothetical protein
VRKTFSAPRQAAVIPANRIPSLGCEPTLQRTFCCGCGVTSNSYEKQIYCVLTAAFSENTGQHNS